MDCEKFESALIDELYEELDDLTSAEAKRHAAGCSRCGALLAGLRATRKVALLPVVMPPPDLEERILAAARDAQKVTPLKSRVQRVMARAGNWAMRPQTAMAAVFLLAIGSSFVFMRSRGDMAPASIKVKAEGAPVALATAGAAPTTAPLDPKNAEGAHGTEEKQTADLATLQPGSPPAAAGPMDLPAKPMASDLDGVGRSALAKDETANAYAEDSRMLNAAPPAGAPAQGQAAGGGGAMAASTSPTDFPSAMNAYRARRFDEAARGFDALSSTDVNAALWAARSLRESRGCGTAVARFDAVNTRAFGTPTGYEAQLDSGRCYRELGNFATARARLAPLLGVPAFAERAQDELDAMAPAAKKSMAAPRAASPSPAPRPAATATSAADVGY